MSRRFVDTAVLVAGGGSGIGLGCAARFLAEGATVTITGRDPQRLAAAARQLDAGDRLRRVVCDVTDPEQVEAAVTATDASAGPRAVVAAPGTGWIAPLAATPVDAWRHVVDTNLTGTFLLLRAAAPRLAAAGGGAFTAISSVNAVRTSRFHAPYCATKAGVDMLVRCAADELATAGIRVNAVRPGLVPTPLSQPLVDEDDLRGSFLDQRRCGGSAPSRRSRPRWRSSPPPRRAGSPGSASPWTAGSTCGPARRSTPGSAANTPTRRAGRACAGSRRSASAGCGHRAARPAEEIHSTVGGHDNCDRPRPLRRRRTARQPFRDRLLSPGSQA